MFRLGAAVAALGVVAASCSVFSDLDSLKGGAADAGSESASGGTGGLGDGSSCFPSPATCGVVGAECGEIDDPSCGKVDCGDCPPGQTCAGTGTENRCGCKPQTCADVGFICGVVQDGCGGLLDCGTCIGDKLCSIKGQCVTCAQDEPCVANKPCVKSAMDCTGTPACVDVAFEPDGTNCGPGLTCDGKGNCACVPKSCQDLGLECGSADDGCGGTIECPTCAPGKVCDAAGKCGACAEGAPCQASAPCKTASMDCSAGTPTCKDTGNAASGTSCGAGQKCDGQGACQCAPKTCADLGKACGSWSDGCGKNVSCGSCGSNKVCDTAGQCVDCVQGASCSASKACTTASVDCSGGAPVCKDTGFSQAGISCGQGMVCNGQGACNACSQGTSCTPAGGACTTGFTDCSSGNAVCVASGNLTNGTSCGNNKVCNNGSCITCNEGGSCAPSQLCKTGTLSCGTGTPVCNAAGNEPNGTPCGTNKVCKSGSCVTCVSGGSCQPANVCMNGVYGCSTGSQVCDVSGPKSNGTDCNPSGCPMQCSGGNCVTYVGWGYANNGNICIGSAYYCPGVSPPPPPSGFAATPTPSGCDYQGCPRGSPTCQSNFCKTCATSNCNGECP